MFAERLRLESHFMDSSKKESQASPDNETVSLAVSEADAGARLDAYLAQNIHGWSRARLQRLIEAGDVLVNSKLAKASHKVSANDEIEVELTPPPESNFTPENIPLEGVTALVGFMKEFESKNG